MVCRQAANLQSLGEMIRPGKRLLKIAMFFPALLILAAAGAYFFPQEILCVDSGPARADIIIVPGGGGTRERPKRAAELFKEDAAPRILLTGGGDDEINRRVLIRNGVPAGAIELEDQSRTTRQNAKFSAAILRAERVHSAIIATSWYHSRRALKTFEHFAPEIKFYSRPSYFWFRRADWRYDFPRHIYMEYVKLPGYWIGYGVWPF